MARKQTRKRPTKKPAAKEPARGQDERDLLCSPFLNLRLLNRSPELIYSLARKVFERHADRLLAHDGVCGVDLGIKMRQGFLTGELSIRVHVRAKLPRGDLAPGERLPIHCEGLPLDVIERRFRTLVGDGHHHETDNGLLGGMSIAPADVPAAFGTMAVAVMTDEGAARYLTCAHVVSDFDPDQGVPMVDTEGTLVGHSDHERHALTTLLDAVLVIPSGNVELFRLRDPNRVVTGVRAVERDDVIRTKRVWMLGATTPGVSFGRVVSVNSRPLEVTDRGRTFHVENQIVIIPDGGSQFARPGDSGGLVVLEETNKAIGIVRGNDDGSGETIATPLIRSELDVDGCAEHLRFII